ncbi:hypothetical protein EPO05_02360 [Patescibacteria group bacterium]|nr:MAG: hypothetical protein EPO05_02360 [Patescibacteria group bacterium]
MDQGKSFQAVVNDTVGLIKEFEKREQKPWGVEGAMIELMKQVGELSACVMMKEKYYLKERELSPKYKNIENNIGDELYDILTLTVRIADHYGIDLEEECRKEIKHSMDIFEKDKK